MASPVHLFASFDNSSEGDCNCACPSDFHLPVLNERFAAKPLIASSTPPVALTGSKRVFVQPYGPGVVVLDAVAGQVLDAFQTPRRIDDAPPSVGLTQAEAQQLARSLLALGLLRPLDAPAAPNASRPQTLVAWLHLTRACNLGCTYCYLTPQTGAMDAATAQAAVDRLFDLAGCEGFRRVKLKYAGGEPLLNFEGVRATHTYASRLSQSSGIGLEAVLLSNGTLLDDEKLAYLKAAGIHLMVSLDGYGAAHDRQRPLRRGGGSFETVVHNIDRAIARGLAPFLSITITSQNVEQLGEVVDFALQRGLRFGLNFYRETGCTTQALTASPERLIAGLRQALQRIEANLPRHSLAAVLDLANLSFAHAHSCGMGQNYLAIDPSGRVARCQMELDRPVTDMSDPDLFARLTGGEAQTPAVDERQGCKACAWRYWCAGGCPRQTALHGGVNPYCAVYRAILPELVRLEGLRLLRQAGAA